MSMELGFSLAQLPCVYSSTITTKLNPLNIIENLIFDGALIEKFVLLFVIVWR